MSQMLSFALRVNDLLDGYRTLIVCFLGSVFNILNRLHVIVVDFDGECIANLSFLALAALFRMLARKPGVLAP